MVSQKVMLILCMIGQVWAIKIRVWRVTNIFSQNVPESSSVTTEDKNIILEAYSTQKVGSGGNFESGNQVNGRW